MYCTGSKAKFKRCKARIQTIAGVMHACVCVCVCVCDSVFPPCIATASSARMPTGNYCERHAVTVGARVLCLEIPA